MDDASLAKLREAANQALGRGNSPEAVKAAMGNAGYAQVDIDAAMGAAQIPRAAVQLDRAVPAAQPAPAAAPATAAKAAGGLSRNMLIALGAGGAAVAITVAALFMMQPAAPAAGLSPSVPDITAPPAGIGQFGLAGTPRVEIDGETARVTWRTDMPVGPGPLTIGYREATPGAAPSKVTATSSDGVNWAASVPVVPGSDYLFNINDPSGGAVAGPNCETGWPLAETPSASSGRTRGGEAKLAGKPSIDEDIKVASVDWSTEIPYGYMYAALLEQNSDGSYTVDTTHIINATDGTHWETTFQSLWADHDYTIALAAPGTILGEDPNGGWKWDFHTSSPPSDCWTESKRNTPACEGVCVSTMSDAEGCGQCHTEGMRDSGFCKDICQHTGGRAEGCDQCLAAGMKGSKFCGGSVCATRDGEAAGCGQCSTEGMRDSDFCERLCSSTDGEFAGCDQCSTEGMKDSKFCKGLCIRMNGEFAGCGQCSTEALRDSGFCGELCADTDGEAAGCGQCNTAGLMDSKFCYGLCRGTDGEAAGCDQCSTEGMRDSDFCAWTCTRSGGDAPGCGQCFTEGMRDSKFCYDLCAGSNGEASGCDQCWTEGMRDASFCLGLCAETNGKAPGCDSCWTASMRNTEFCNGLCDATQDSATGCSMCWMDGMKDSKFCREDSEYDVEDEIEEQLDAGGPGERECKKKQKPPEEPAKPGEEMPGSITPGTLPKEAPEIPPVEPAKKREITEAMRESRPVECDMIMTQEGSSVYQHAWIEHPNLRSEGRVLSGSMSMMGAATGTPSGVPSMPGGMPSGMPGGMPSGMPELPSGLSDMLGGMAVAVPGMPAGAMGGAGTTMKGISKGGVMYVNVPSMFCKKWIKIDYAAFGVEVPTAQKVEEYWADPPSYMQINCWEVEDIPDSYFELPAGAETTDLQTLLSAVTDIENMFSGGSIGDLEGAIGKNGFPFDPCEEEPTGTLPVDVEDYCKLKPGETLGEYEPQPELSPAYCPIGGMPPAGLEPPPKSGWPARAKVCLNSMRTWVQDASDWAGEKEALAGDYYAKQWGQSGNPLWAIPAVASYGGNDLISTLCEPTDWVQSAVMLDDPDVGRGTKVCVALAMALPIASGAFGKKVANIVSGYADEAVGAATRKVDNILGRAPASSASKLDVARAVDVGDASTADAFKAGTTGTANARPSSGINVPDPNTEAKSAASIKDSVVQSAGPYKTTAKEFLKVGDSGKTYKRIMDDFVEETKNNIDTPIITAEGNYRKTYLIPDDLPRSSLPPGILTAKVPEGPVAVKVIDYAPSMGPGGKWGDAMDFEGSPGLTPNELPHVDLINERDNMAEVNKALAAKGYKRFFPEVYDVEYKRTRVGTLTRGLEVDEDAARRGMMCGKTGDPIYAVKGMASMERLQEKSVRDIESEFKELMGSTPDPTSKAEQLLQKVNDKLKQTGDDLDSLLKEHDLIWNDPHAENMAMAFEYKGTKYYSAEDVLASGADIGDVEVYMRAYEMGGAVKEAGKGGLVRLKYRDELRVR